MDSAIHNALLIFFGTMVVWNALTLAGSQSRAIAPIVGALATGGLGIESWISGSTQSAGAALSAGLVGIVCAVVFSRQLAVWAKR